ncbi:glucitol/sorbitol PTS system EIIA component [Aerococcus sp. 150760007-1]|uniref:PTS glucitol/sorbitol transporter subunit IIA n=1 Tax=Aerococcus urinaeequi TaxID=51665 RepID=A0ABR5ZYA4_9LACT|nr:MULTISPECIES: PTS glucitol/sorbitol transporter subunit IIA [Lactobacillales]KAF3306372.1 PTS sorbitol transporter subunit IIA [Carnobacterium sp. PL17GRE32]MBA5746723.1 PTS glucitol/sorbitol transporter subunit IIA [Aerococcus urinaeequi]MBA5829482.1 PTS glucitol/sorbitol transporter subunit IIA [Aerococcus urinaeequi]MBA5860411.1 PTS glucitol/sorbitol transporter subunit IIA [Aerococcus urinaeequi]HCT98282.1 PTS sorbitol transporter subunit IIA [Aerococcus urinaeequi]
MSIYQTKILNIGPEAEIFKEEKMMILFGDDAPADLADYCYGIEKANLSEEIQVGQYVVIEGHEFQITAVGNVVNKNLQELGHITIKFDGAVSPELAGTLYVEDKPIPNVENGSEISIV